MPKPFHQLSLEEFADLLARFPFHRKIDVVHMHHTWRPNHSQYRGLETIEAMWRFHTQQNGWSDIAQHISIAPDGTIWTGRDWNKAPASATGHNGNSITGPLMFETIGDFDLGRDRFEGRQRETVIEVIARVQMRFGLPVEALRFHNQMTDQKSCPGTAIKLEEILNAVRERRANLEQANRDAASRGADERPFGDDALAARSRTSEIIASLGHSSHGGNSNEGRATRDGSANLELHAELTEEQTSSTAMASLFYEIDVTTQRAPVNGRRDVRRGLEFTPGMLNELRPHVINLNQGRFSSEGKFVTTPGDVDAIFGEHLERELQAARARNEKLRVLFFAHGGLVSESSGLQIAHKHINWWMKNHIYPIHFVWETGLFETIGQILQGTRQRAAAAGARDIFDVTTDPLVEVAARKLGGEKIWSGMKRSAELASADDGGARYVADKLKQFCDAHQGEVELYAVGHSAGSIFHAHFIPMALNLGVPAFQSVHFLAPAIRVDTFQQRLAPRMGQGINQLNIFTMAKDWEKADNCAQVYRKSLLYLIYHALEPESKTPLLGLEESLRADQQLCALFGLGGHQPRHGEVILAKSKTDTGRNAATSTTHGGFDDDAATMNSVARRILNVGDEVPISNFPKPDEARSFDGWNALIEWPEEFAYRLEENIAVAPPLRAAIQTPTMVTPAALIETNITGRRRALCIGINQYPTAPLMGCVADAQSWAGTLTQLGFEAQVLLDEQATRAGIINALREIVTSSSSGDIVVFQYAGHGTQLPDHNADEKDDRKDEALCPFDFASGAFVIDDDVAEVFRSIPEGVNVTCFVDCCHSGTISRFAIGAATGSEARNQKMRFLKATPEMEQAHLDFRHQRGFSRAALPLRLGPETMKEVVFSACLPSEVAWESDGHGDFTVRATKLLLSGLGRLTHEEFQRQVIEAFGSTPRQHPTLDCAPMARALGLLQARARSAGGMPPMTAKAAAGKF